jgi:hypothetical protein
MLKNSTIIFFYSKRIKLPAGINNFLLSRVSGRTLNKVIFPVSPIRIFSPEQYIVRWVDSNNSSVFHRVLTVPSWSNVYLFFTDKEKFPKIVFHEGKLLLGLSVYSFFSKNKFLRESTEKFLPLPNAFDLGRSFYIISPFFFCRAVALILFYSRSAYFSSTKKIS